MSRRVKSAHVLELDLGFFRPVGDAFVCDDLKSMNKCLYRWYEGVQIPRKEAEDQCHWVQRAADGEDIFVMYLNPNIGDTARHLTIHISHEVIHMVIAIMRHAGEDKWHKAEETVCRFHDHLCYQIFDWLGFSAKYAKVLRS